MNLNDRALLVQLTISQWSARKLDKRATKEVAENHGAIDAAGRYNKSLLPLNDYLANVGTKTGLIRNRYLDNTLPWGIEGTRILPSANYLAFMTDFRKQKSEWEYAVGMFLDHYGDLKDSARRLLGSLYNEADYPSEQEITGKFKMDMAVFPVPSTDFRVALSNDEMTSIKSDLESRLKQSQQAAMKDVWERLYERVKHMVERLSDPKSRFHDSLIDNARELCALLPRLNFTDDPDLEMMRSEVEAKLAHHNPEILRNNPDLRRDTAEEAKAIMEKMSVFMGGL